MLARDSFPTVVDRVNQDAINAYADLSGDFNPLHVDPEAAAASEFGGIIAHGPIALHAFFLALTGWLGVEALPASCEVSVTYRAPTRPGDEITCDLREMEDAGDGRVRVEAECVNQDAITVVSVSALIAAPAAVS